MFYKVQTPKLFSYINHRNGKKKTKNCKYIIKGGNMKVVINKFVLLPRLRKEVGQVDFSFKKLGVTVHTT